MAITRRPTNPAAGVLANVGLVGMSPSGDVATTSSVTAGSLGRREWQWDGAEYDGVSLAAQTALIGIAYSDDEAVSIRCVNSTTITLRVAGQTARNFNRPEAVTYVEYLGDDYFITGSFNASSSVRVLKVDRVANDLTAVSVSVVGFCRGIRRKAGTNVFALITTPTTAGGTPSVRFGSIDYTTGSLTMTAAASLALAANNWACRSMEFNPKAGDFTLALSMRNTTTLVSIFRIARTNSTGTVNTLVPNTGVVTTSFPRNGVANFASVYYAIWVNGGDGIQVVHTDAAPWNQHYYYDTNTLVFSATGDGTLLPDLVDPTITMSQASVQTIANVDGSVFGFVVGVTPFILFYDEIVPKTDLIAEAPMADAVIEASINEDVTLIADGVPMAEAIIEASIYESVTLIADGVPMAQAIMTTTQDLGLSMVAVAPMATPRMDILRGVLVNAIAVAPMATPRMDLRQHIQSQFVAVAPMADPKFDIFSNTTLDMVAEAPMAEAVIITEGVRRRRMMIGLVTVL